MMIILIFITSYVFYKLYSVLGNGNIEDLLKKKKNINSSQNEPEMVNLEDVEETVVDEDSEKLIVKEDVRQVLDKLHNLEKNFKEKGFIKSAASAFEYILKIFAEEEKFELKRLLSSEIYENFIDDIEERKTNKLKKHHTLVSLDQPVLIDARIEDNNVWLTVEFVSKQVNYYTNFNDEVVKGNKASIDTIKDIWTFTRKINSSSPIWKLEETK